MKKIKDKIIKVLLWVLERIPEMGIFSFLIYILIKTILCHGFGVCLLF